MKRCIFVLAVLLFTCLLSASDPVFYCNFDDTAEPQMAAGDKTPKLEVQPKFEQGIRGRALLVGMDADKTRRGVSYSNEKNLNWTQGAISFWVKPVNWKGSDTGFFAPFFTAGAGKNYFLIYKYPVGETLYFMRGELGFWLFSQYRPGEWKSGEWHHVVCL